MNIGSYFKCIAGALLLSCMPVDATSKEVITLTDTCRKADGQRDATCSSSHTVAIDVTNVWIVGVAGLDVFSVGISCSNPDEVQGFYRSAASHMVQVRIQDELAVEGPVSDHIIGACGIIPVESAFDAISTCGKIAIAIGVRAVCDPRQPQAPEGS